MEISPKKDITSPEVNFIKNLCENVLELQQKLNTFTQKYTFFQIGRILGTAEIVDENRISLIFSFAYEPWPSQQLEIRLDLPIVLTTNQCIIMEKIIMSTQQYVDEDDELGNKEISLEKLEKIKQIEIDGVSVTFKIKLIPK